MGRDPSQLLVLIGAGAAACAVVLGLIALFFFKSKWAALERQYDREYGEEPGKGTAGAPGSAGGRES